MQRIRGRKGKSRHKLSKKRRDKGKVSISKYMQSFKEGQKVHLSLEPAVHRGTYHMRFKGITGTITKECGSCYEVTFSDKGRQKKLVVHPVHLVLTQ